MTIPATDTAIDIAYWFFNRAEKDGIYLETEKMQHLLFLAQIHFAMAYNMQIPVTILGTDPRMENQAFQLAIRLEPSEDLELGLSYRTLARIQFSSMLTMPYYWDEFYWGPYSKVKHEKLIELLGVDFPATEDEYYDDYDLWEVYCNYLSQWFAENYPVEDENGNPIDPWYVN